jgi:type IV pilus assembly protein PilC
MGKNRMAFIQNLSTMIGAGLTLVDALKTLEKEIRSRSMKKVIANISEAVENGSPLWRAMESQYLFDPYEISLVRIGEEAGNLTQNMKYLVEQQEKTHRLKQKVKMAMIYPIIVLILMFVVVMGMGLFVLPNLVGVLLALNADLPFATRVLIEISRLFTEYGEIVTPLSIGLVVLLFLLGKYTAFRAVTQWFALRIPGIGRLAREATIARFGVMLGGLLQAGVPLVEALESLVDATGMVSYKNLYARILERIRLGDSFSTSFEKIGKRSRILPISVQQLVTTGEKSGKLSDILLKIANIYDQKASETAEKLPTILEPALLLIIGGLVGGIAFAIITPIYSVVGNIG